MYESPIHITFDDYPKITKQIMKNQEEHIVGVINEYVKVDKDELLKALAYDRDQYKKGYDDGYHEAKKIQYQPIYGEWIFKRFDVASGITGSLWCSNCGEVKCQVSDKFCAWCGANMSRYISKDKEVTDDDI